MRRRDIIKKERRIVKIAALFYYLFIFPVLLEVDQNQPPAATIYKITQINILDNFILVV